MWQSSEENMHDSKTLKFTFLTQQLLEEDPKLTYTKLSLIFPKTKLCPLFITEHSASISSGPQPL
jgi:hypothetical protein